MHMKLLQLVDVRVEEAFRPLREEMAALKLLLARVGVSLEPAGTCPSYGLGLTNAWASTALDSSVQMSSVVQVVEEEHLYGCFSPRGQSSLPDVLAASERETLDLEKGGGVDAPVSLSPGSGRQVVPIGDGVAESRVLTPMPGAFVAREICIFLATLAAAYPGCDSPKLAFGRTNLTSANARRGVLQQRHLQLLDGCPLCSGMSLSARCRCVMSRVFVRVALWSHLLG